MTEKITISNVMAYITGKLRYRLYYSRYKFLIRTHIQEQIDLRVKFMKKACYENGECVMCGCQTTALQMAGKSCNYPCYPTMMGRDRWLSFSKQGKLIRDDVNMCYWRLSSITGFLHRLPYKGLEAIIKPKDYVDRNNEGLRTTKVEQAS